MQGVRWTPCGNYLALDGSHLATFTAIETARLASLRILLVDDDAGVGEFISAAAQSLNVPCTATASAAAFMAAFTPDATLVIVDLVMPDMDGVELLRWLQRQQCKAEILLMSGMDKRVLETAVRLAE